MLDEAMNDFCWHESKTPAHDYLIEAIRKILEDFNIPKQAKILDAGCGGGYVVHVLHKMHYQNIWGFDISKSGIDVSRSSFPEIKDRFITHDAYEKELPNTFPSLNYDLILSLEVIEHLYDPTAYLENIYSWLKQSGYLIITTPYHGYLKNLVITALNKFDGHFHPLSSGGHIKFFSQRTLYTILRNNNFKPIKFSGAGRCRYLWKSMIVLAQKI
jgi:2-polyprenyl-3-methyl-5-hydroxy-6-metoxy-1,4-benzoquinol methylase